MMNIKLLAVVKPPTINHGCSTRKTFWEENFTGEEKLTLGEFKAVNMKNCVTTARSFMLIITHRSHNFSIDMVSLNTVFYL